MEGRTRHLTVSLTSASASGKYYGPYVQIPYIRLQGKWLENSGFNIGDKIVVTESDKELKISVLN